MRILYVTKALNQEKKDGGNAVSIRNYEILKSLSKDTVIDLFEIEKPTRYTLLKNLLMLKSYGENKNIKKNFVQKLRNNYDFIFFNGSLYNTYEKLAYKQGIKTITFFHNIEKLYYQSRFKTERNFLSFVFSKYIAYIENKAVSFTDFCIVLNDRDNSDLEKQYKRDADLILPISMPILDKSILNKTLNCSKKYCMFLGSNFFANQEGICWFIENVMPYVNIELHIVGSICDFLENKYKNLKNVFLEGYVDDTAMWYNSASYIVSPIFTGSGMKTKTIEALSYGKLILGTDEAFVGIKQSDINNCGVVCNTATDFIKQMNEQHLDKYFYQGSYNVFLQSFSDKVVIEKLKDFFNRIVIK